jgi:hypothetical protein
VSAGRRQLPLLGDLPAAPGDPQAGTPVRRPGSVRRTAHWHVTWPAGIGTDMHVSAVARDLVTDVQGTAHESGRAAASVVVDPRRHVRSVRVVPDLPGVAELVGARGGGGFRSALRAALPDDRAIGSLGHLLLDDLPGVTLVGPYAWRLFPDWSTRPPRTGRGHDMTGVCTGFRPDGVPAQRLRTGEDLQQNLVPAPAGEGSTDPLGWHDVPAPEAGTTLFRRRRRIDVSAGAEVTVDSWFRDSMWHPDGREIVVHEYGVTARIDPGTGRLTSVTAVPRVLPFPTCPAASAHVAVLVGEPASTLRSRVVDLLPGTDGCTHLNDALRALAEAPLLLAAAATGSGGR